ncbi:MAG: hypothetical protein WAV54_13290 [Acidimicrobiales bacterium]
MVPTEPQVRPRLSLEGSRALNSLRDDLSVVARESLSANDAVLLLRYLATSIPQGDLRRGVETWKRQRPGLETTRLIPGR